MRVNTAMRNQKGLLSNIGQFLKDYSAAADVEQPLSRETVRVASLILVLRTLAADIQSAGGHQGECSESKAMTRLLVVHSRKSDCLFNLGHGLWGKILRKGAKHSCVELLAKDLDHLTRPCACFGRVNDHAVFKDAVQRDFSETPLSRRS